MNRSHFLVAGLAATLALAGSAQPAAAALVNRATIALSTSYVLKAKLDFAAGTIAATETITLKNVSGSTISKVNLAVVPKAFGELTSISTFRVNGAPVGAAWTNNANLEVQLGRNVADGQTVTLSLAFAVKATSQIATSLEGRLSKANDIMQVSHWFPIVSDGQGVRYPGDSRYTRVASKFRLELTTSSTSIKVAAPGIRVVASGVNHVYELTNARDFAFSVSPSYRVLASSTGGVAIGVYYTTGSASAALSTAIAAVNRFETTFGQYQWSRLIVAQSPRPSSGNEYPGIVFIGGPAFGATEVVAHEVAHQWFYGMAGNDQMREPWLDEGISEFAASYWFGTINGYSSTRPVNSSIYEFPNLPAPSTSGDPGSYDQTVYFKSAAFLNGLRTRMGNSRFFAALTALYTANRNGTMTTREFYDTFARYGAPTSYLAAFIRL
jgi:aminopeptidase N